MPARLLTGPYAVGDFGDHSAADRAMRADILASRHRRAGRRRRAGVGLADCPKRERTKRGPTAGSQTGTAQKAAAIESVACFKRKRRNMHAAPGFASCPSDQHECPSLGWIAVDP